MERFFINQKDNSNVIVGGVKVLSEFSSEQVVVGVIGARVVVTGEKLKIARFDENEICVSGRILNVETLNRRARDV